MLLPFSSQNVSERIKAGQVMSFIVNQILEKIKVTNGELPCSNSEAFSFSLFISICHVLGLVLKSLRKCLYYRRAIRIQHESG